jgi:diguanylate cyclase (GGDEF)-like protein/PAS domain S-box-containing protein
MVLALARETPENAHLPCEVVPLKAFEVVGFVSITASERHDAEPAHGPFERPPSEPGSKRTIAVLAPTMQQAPIRSDEVRRLQVLDALQILDTPPEVEFDALVRVAAQICGTPIALINLLDATRQWVKAEQGMPGLQSLPRELSFCGHTIMADGLFEVPDLQLDPRFGDSPLVRSTPHLRFYAGVPLRMDGGEAVGTLCVLGHEPKHLDARQREALVQLGLAVVKALVGRRASLVLQRLALELADRQQYLQYAVDHVPSMLAYWDADLRCRFANRAYEQWFGVQVDKLLGCHLSELLEPALFAANKPHLDAALRGEAQTFECTVPGPGGVQRHSLAYYGPHVVDGVVRGILLQVIDIGPLHHAEVALRVEVAEHQRTVRLLEQRSKALSEAQRLGRIGSWEWNTETDQAHWSDALARIFDRDPALPVPRREELQALYTPRSWADWQAAVQRMRATAEPQALQLELAKPDGAPVWAQARIEAMRAEDGRIIGMRGTMQDITEQRLMALDLAHQHELLRVTLRSIGDAVITTDAAGRVAWLNSTAERLTGWTDAEANGRPLTEVFNIVSETTRERVPNPVDTCLAEGRVVELSGHTLLIARDGRQFGIEDSAAPMRTDSGDVLGVVLVFRDVTEQRRMSGEMTYRATHDMLTGLVNRSEFEGCLQRQLDHARATAAGHALLYIDLDQFKLVNDSCGHAVGDELLQRMGDELADSVRSGDTLARLGGDEFAIILSHCDAAQALLLAQRICDRMNEFRFIHAERRFRIGVSIGLVPVDARWANVAAILQAADASCYAAKEAGRNRVHLWSDNDQVTRERHVEVEWTTRIERALDEGGFELHAQRITPLAGAPQGLHAELLLRLRADDGCLVLPGAFLPAAERFHLVTRIDRWVLRRALDWMAALPGLQGIELLTLNLSGHSVGDRAFHTWACEQLALAGQAVCSRLCLEITETAAVTNLADAALFIDQVRSAGVRVALDDFGAGASSFSYLKQLQVDLLKIDGQFIRELVTDPLNEAAVRCFIEVARVRGLQTVAEFVDSESVLQRLRQMGVDWAQGYLLHRPAPLDELYQAVMTQRQSLSTTVPKV